MLAFIPCRMGSKRIPNKNIKDFDEQPIINYSIAAAIESKLFNLITISTDQPYKILTNIKDEYVKNVNIVERNKDLSGDKVILYDTLIDYLQQINYHEKYICLIYPCAPFITAKRLIEGYDLLVQGYDVIFPITKSIPVGHLLQKVECNNVEINKVLSKKVKVLYPSLKDQNSNGWSETYTHAGQWFFCDVKKLYGNKTLIPENSGYIELPWYEAQDIDTLDDWEIAQLKYSYFKQVMKC